MTIAVKTMDALPATGAVSLPDRGRSFDHEDAVAVSIFTPADRQLVQNCLQGQPAAWDAFLGRFVGLLAFIVNRTAAQRRIMLTSADRDDLLADILLEIIHHDAAVLRSFAGRSSLATYLAVVARRVAVRGLTRLVDNSHGRRPIAAGDEPASPMNGENGQAHLADQEQVTRLLSGLEEGEARLVRLHHLEARSYGEISRLTGMPLGSIGPALARARQKMKRQAES